jgi:PIN domain nuclease of toxin-antitoxin system
VKPVLDASALLAYLHREPGWDRVRADLAGACIGAVNWCEVAHKASRKGLDVLRVRSLMQDLEVSIIPFSQEQAELAASLWSITASHGLSLADRACLALATERQLPILTADRAWSELRLGLDIQLIR